MISNGSYFFEIMFNFQGFDYWLINLIQSIENFIETKKALLDKYMNKNHWNLLIKVDHMD
jgi:hypothetical protein